MLEVAKENGFSFDTVQMPLNVMDAHYRSFETLVLPELVKQNIGVLGMKSMANGIILKSGTVSAEECLRYALNLPASVVITGVDSMEILDQACEAARTFRPLSDTELTALLSKTAKAAALDPAVLAVTLAGPGNARAQVYPTRPITMIVPFPAGGPTDTIGRVVAEGTHDELLEQSERYREVLAQARLRVAGQPQVHRDPTRAADQRVHQRGGDVHRDERVHDELPDEVHRIGDLRQPSVLGQ